MNFPTLEQMEPIKLVSKTKYWILYMGDKVDVFKIYAKAASQEQAAMEYERAMSEGLIPFIMKEVKIKTEYKEVES